MHMFARSENETVISYLYKTTGIIYRAAKKPTGGVHWAIIHLRLNTEYMKDVAIYVLYSSLYNSTKLPTTS